MWSGLVGRPQAVGFKVVRPYIQVHHFGEWFLDCSGYDKRYWSRLTVHGPWTGGGMGVMAVSQGDSGDS